MSQELVAPGSIGRQCKADVATHELTVDRPNVHVGPHVSRAPHHVLVPGCSGRAGRQKVIPAQSQRL